ncbi:MAG: phage tail sheath family protein [Adhaeribacter sp.]
MPDTPGVYLEEIPAFPSSIIPVETAVPAFVGYTRQAVQGLEDLSLRPYRLASLVEYELLFGKGKAGRFQANVNLDSATGAYQVEIAEKPAPSFLLYEALQAYFANGGGPCYLVSVGTLQGNGPELASLLQGLEKLRDVAEVSLLLSPDASLLSDADYARWATAALQQCRLLQNRFALLDVSDRYLSNADITTCFRNLLPADTSLTQYGAAYYPFVQTTFAYQLLDEQGESPSLLGQYTVDHLALPGQDDYSGSPLNRVQEINPALYQLIADKIQEIGVVLPPSSLVAGVYASVDRSRGVWKAPANVRLSGVTGPTVPVSGPFQSELAVDAATGKSVNVLRTFPGMGTLVWGARTLAGNDPEWRYVPVRRFCTFVAESIRKATGSLVFEPNNATTWLRVQAMTENFLTTLWQQGALPGAKPEQAFFVKIGLGSTMTALDILEGRLILEVGLAPLRPAEFILLLFQFQMEKA